MTALEVDAELPGAGLGRERVDVGLRERDREQAVLEAAVEEDVAEARRDDAADPEAAYGPYGGLARAAAREVRAREQDRRVAIGILVERAVGVQRSVGV